MPPAILKGRPHRTRTVGAVTVDAVVGDVQLRAGAKRTLVPVERISQHERLASGGKADRIDLVVRNDSKSVAAVSESRLRGLRRLLRRRHLRGARIDAAR